MQRRRFLSTLSIPLIAAGGLSLSTTAAAAVTPAELRSVSAWEDLFLTSWIDKGGWTEAKRRSTSGDSWLHYHLSYYLDAAISMARATGNPDYYANAMELIADVIDTSAVSSTFPGSQFQDSYRGWVSQRADTLNKEVPLFESILWRYVLNAVRLEQEQPRLRRAFNGRRKAAASTTSILAFAEENMFTKWYERSPQNPTYQQEHHLYRSRTHMASHWAYISLGLLDLSSDS